MSNRFDTLEVFDFDWTLFRSPSPPDGSPGKTWLASEDSLLPPYVPLRAPRSLWIEEVVKEMKSSQRSMGSLTILLTGRRGKTGPRIKQLLAQRGLEPDQFHLRSASFAKDKDSVVFKRSVVDSILRVNPQIVRVVVWEDNLDQMSSLQDLAEKRKNLDFWGNLVTDGGLR